MVKGFGLKSQNQGKNKQETTKKRPIVSIKEIQESLLSYVDEIKDPRVQRSQRHKLTDILAITILAVIGGAQGWEDMENYGLAKEQWLEEFLELPNGMILNLSARK